MERTARVATVFLLAAAGGAAAAPPDWMAAGLARSGGCAFVLDQLRDAPRQRLADMTAPLGRSAELWADVDADAFLAFARDCAAAFVTDPADLERRLRQLQVDLDTARSTAAIYAGADASLARVDLPPATPATREAWETAKAEAARRQASTLYRQLELRRREAELAAARAEEDRIAAKRAHQAAAEKRRADQAAAEQAAAEAAAADAEARRQRAEAATAAAAEFEKQLAELKGAADAAEEEAAKAKATAADAERAAEEAEAKAAAQAAALEAERARIAAAQEAEQKAKADEDAARARKTAAEQPPAVEPPPAPFSAFLPASPQPAAPTPPEQPMASAPPIDEVAEIRAGCIAEWGTDYQMVAYCIDQQQDARREVTRFEAAAGVDAIAAGILERCRAEWPAGRSYDWTMVRYCYEQQSDAYRRLN